MRIVISFYILEILLGLALNASAADLTASAATPHTILPLTAVLNVGFDRWVMPIEYHHAIPPSRIEDLKTKLGTARLSELTMPLSRPSIGRRVVFPDLRRFVAYFDGSRPEPDAAITVDLTIPSGTEIDLAIRSAEIEIIRQGKVPSVEVITTHLTGHSVEISHGTILSRLDANPELGASHAYLRALASPRTRARGLITQATALNLKMTTGILCEFLGLPKKTIHNMMDGQIGEMFKTVRLRQLPRALRNAVKFAINLGGNCPLWCEPSLPPTAKVFTRDRVKPAIAELVRKNIPINHTTIAQHLNVDLSAVSRSIKKSFELQTYVHKQIIVQMANRIRERLDPSHIPAFDDTSYERAYAYLTYTILTHLMIDQYDNFYTNLHGLRKKPMRSFPEILSNDLGLDSAQVRIVLADDALFMEEVHRYESREPVNIHRMQRSGIVDAK